MTAFGWPGVPCEEPPVYWYRYEDVAYSRGCDELDRPLGPAIIKVELRKFRVHHHTPKGVRLEDGQFVSDSSRKRFAHATVDEAKESFIARKERQMQIHQARINRAIKALNLIKYGTEYPPFTSTP